MSTCVYLLFGCCLCVWYCSESKSLYASHRVFLVCVWWGLVSRCVRWWQFVPVSEMSACLCGSVIAHLWFLPDGVDVHLCFCDRFWVPISEQCQWQCCMPTGVCMSLTWSIHICFCDTAYVALSHIYVCLCSNAWMSQASVWLSVTYSGTLISGTVQVFMWQCTFDGASVFVTSSSSVSDGHFCVIVTW